MACSPNVIARNGGSPQQHLVVDQRAQRVAAPRRNHVLRLEVLDTIQVRQVDCKQRPVGGRLISRKARIAAVHVRGMLQHFPRRETGTRYTPQNSAGCKGWPGRATAAHLTCGWAAAHPHHTPAVAPTVAMGHNRLAAASGIPGSPAHCRRLAPHVSGQQAQRSCHHTTSETTPNPQH